MIGRIRMLMLRRAVAIPAVGIVVAVVVGVFASIGSATATCTIYWGGGTSNQWNVASNWLNSTGGSAGHTPGSTDFVCMSSSATGGNGVTPQNTSVQLPSGASSTVTGINWPQISGSSPSLEVDGTLKLGTSTTANASTINALSVPSGGIVAANVSGEAASVGTLTAAGTLEGPGTITATGTSTLSYPSLGASGTTATAAHLIVSGTTTLPNTYVYFYDGSKLEVASGGTLALNDGSELVNEDGKTTNQLDVDSGGSTAYTATASGNYAYVAVPTTGAGTFSVGGGGTLDLSAGTLSTGSDAGTFSADSGSTLLLQGTRKAASGLTVTGSGTVDDQATEVFSGSQTVTDNGTLQIDGTLQGPATPTVSGTGTLVLNSTSLGVSGASDAVHLIDQTASSMPASALLYFYDGSVLENKGSMTLNDNSDMVNEDGNASNAFVNDSGASVSYAETASGGNAYLQVPAANNGSVSVTAGTLQLMNGGTSAADSGTFTAASGATLDLNGTRTEGSNATMGGAGTIDIQGTDTFNSGSTATNTGTFQVDGALIAPQNVTVALANLTLNGTLEGPGGFSVSGPATLNTASLGAYGTAGTQTQLTLKGQTSVTNWVYFSNGSELENQNALTLTDSSNLYNYDGNAGNEVVNDSNASISYSETASGSNAYIGVPAANNGSVSVTAGTLQLTGGGTSSADSGTFTAASGATLDLNGTRTEGSGATLAGAGTIDIQGTDTFNSGSGVTNTGTFQVDGVVVAPQGATIALANLTANGTLEGPGGFTVSGPATLNSSFLGAYGTAGTQTQLTLKGQTSVTAGVYFSNGSELENQGTITLADNSNLINYDGSSTNEFVNDSGATISYEETASGSNAYIGVPAANNGSISVTAGTLQITGGGTSSADSGTFTAASGATLDLNGTRTEGSTATLGGAGTIDVQGTDTFNSGSTATNTGTFQVDGVLIAPQNVTVSLANLTLNGTLEGPGGFSVSGPATLNSSFLGVYGTAGTQTHLTVQGQTSLTATIYLSNGSEVENQGTITQADNTNFYNYDGNAGNEVVNDSGATISYTGSTTNGNAYIGLSLTNNGTLNVGEGALNLTALTNLDSSGNLTGGTYTAVGGTLVLPGTIVTNAANITLGASPSSFTANSANALATLTSNTGSLDLKGPLTTTSAVSNSGTVTVEKGQFATGTGYSQSAGTTKILGGSSGGTLKPGTSGATISGGTLTGTGAISGKLIGGGNITPAGTVTGPMTVSNTFNNNSGTLTIPISGTTNPGTDYGELSAAGAATASGKLAISTASGYSPPDGTTYTILQGSSVSGTFSTVTGAVLSDRMYALTYNPTNVTATVHYFPVVTGVSPSSGPAAGGPTNGVTITGQHFQATSATGAVTGVSFGGVPATNFTIVDDSHITATPPAGSAGTVDVTVTGPYGTSPTSAADHYTYQPASSGPTVTSVTPSAGPTTKGTAVTIAGSGFTGATAVSFGGTAAVSFKVTSDSQITATAPAHAAGSVDVQVTTPQGTSPISQPADVYTFDAKPTVSSISPAIGPLAGTNTVTVNGANFVTGATVKFGTTPGSNVSIVSSKQLTVTVPATSTAGSVDVTVATPGGTSSKSAKDLYAYGPPTISSFTPTTGITGSTVTVTGSGFASGVSAYFGSTKVTPKIVSGTTLTVVVPNGDASPTPIKVSDTQGSQTSSSDFTPTMAITGFSPTSGSKSAGTLVTITGIGFSSNSVVAFNKVNAATTYVSSTQLTATVPSTASTGLITVTSPSGDSPAGTVTSKSKFTVNP